MAPSSVSAGPRWLIIGWAGARKVPAAVGAGIYAGLTMPRRMISSTDGKARRAISGMGSPPAACADGSAAGDLSGLTDDDPPNHAGMLVWDTEEIVDAFIRERDREALVRQQVVRVPGLGTLRDAQRALEVLRMVGCRGMGIPRVQVDPADRLTRLDAKANRVEPDLRAVRIALHPDLDCLSGEWEPGPCQTGEESPADPQDMSARDHHFAATRCSSAFGTCHRTT